MKFTHLFTDRPILSTVLSVLIVLVGAISFFTLPVSLYPDIVPPTIQVQASLPGASAKTVSDVVATPLEQEINGVENLLYIESQSTDDGNLTITVTFELGTNLEIAQVQVQNRVARAEPRLPQETRQIGITTQKNSPDMLMVVHLLSPDNTYDQLYIANYATLRIRDQIARLNGVGQINVFGASEYAMRIWVDPDRMTALNLSAADVISALRGQNVQVASGNLNQEPSKSEGAFRLNVQTQGRLTTSEQFEDIIVKNEDGRIVKLSDIAEVELGGQNYSTRSYLDKNPAVAMPIFQRPGTNALDTAEAIKSLMEDLSQDFPPGLEYRVVYNPTEFVQQSINEVFKTIIEAIILVVIVISLFLQSFRAAIIPILAIPISLIGTYAVMAMMGFSLNTLTLFGLVLAIGIVVDDAIIVVEDAARNISEGMNPKDAAHKTMDEVGTALVASALVLISVFIPTSFLTGISGQFYSQFALTIAVATFFSMVVSLTLSPALCAIVLKDPDDIKRSKFLRPIDFIFKKFNNLIKRLSGKYADLLSNWVILERPALMVYVMLLVITYFLFSTLPRGFIPQQDQGYFITVVQLPPGASLDRTDAVVKQIADRFLQVDGVKNTVAFAGFSGATFTNAPNAAAVFVPLRSFDYRNERGITFNSLLGALNQQASRIEGGNVFVVPPPTVRGIGNAGGFKMMVQDRSGAGPSALNAATRELAGEANRDPIVVNAFTTFETNTPKLQLDIEEERVERLGVNVNEVNQALELMIGSVFINDFNFLGRTYRVTAQADAPYRVSENDIMNIRVRNNEGYMVPLGSVSSIEETTGPSRVPRYNLFPAAALSGNIAPGVSTGKVLNRMEELAGEVLPSGISFEWTELAFQQRQAGNIAIFIFILSVIFAFLILSAQYESWLLPLAIILIVPMCIFSASIGLQIMGQDVNVLTQIGLVVLIALASKNAILIVEFAKQKEDIGMNRWKGAIEAAKIRLRPILMTAFSFIMGVAPLLLSTGAGAEMRYAIGLAVFSGMAGVTFLGLAFTPVFYVVSRSIAKDQRGIKKPEDAENKEES